MLTADVIHFLLELLHPIMLGDVTFSKLGVQAILSIQIGALIDMKHPRA